MLGFLQTTQTATIARIGDEEIVVQPGETLLQAALRQGIAFPNSCRVGGCGACKCRVKRGEVRELTETGYLLTAEELAARTVLACQSTPLSDVEIELDRPHAVPGEVVAQQRLTHDITRLDVQLSEPLGYRPGQFARLSLDGLPDVVRSYSFATPPRADGRASFFIRHVPGGRFSGLVHQADVVGRGVRVEGPSGAFWLRGATAPALFVAGGSGLAPILAMLEAAADEGVTRPATVLFGARSQRDLYALDQLSALAARWRGGLTVVPVLSDEPADSDWTGARGLVTAHIGAHLSPRTHAYLCGPPAMVDAALVPLREAGVPAEHIHFDRFTTAADGATTDPAIAPGPVAGLLHYAKFCLFHLLGLYTVASLLGGGWFTSLGLLGLVSIYVLGDHFGGDDTSTPDYRHPAVLTGLLWLGLPLVALATFTSVWTVSAGDPLGYGALVTALTGVDVLAARDATGWGHHLAGLVLTILTVGLVALIPGHELVHRTWDRASLTIGRWLYAFAFDANFSIEHVHGHHRYVSTVHDPGTAPRGRSVYAHVLISTLRGNLSGFRIERERLRRKQLPVWSLHNTWLRGHAMGLLLLGIAGLLGGPVGAAWFAACGLGGKAILEMVNYLEHYGMVRDPADPVQPHHSWNTNRRVSSWSMFNLTRHSHHHAQGEVPYGELRPYPDAPMMVDGYLSTMFLTMVPPLWHRLMTPKVLEWDRVHATASEKRMAWAANRASGLAAFQGADPAVYGVEQG
ncbi:MAG: fatty acid desaturase [Alphaproteobacteria bacterium]|nr:fatty acid desaturase [Alphaproteobacteria bacterium]